MASLNSRVENAKKHSISKDITLQGKYIHLKLLNAEQDTETLFHRSNGKAVEISGGFCNSVEDYDPEEEVWKYMFTSTTAQQTLEEYKAVQVESLLELSRCTAFVVFDSASNSQIGVLCYLNNFPEHLKVEIGSVWYSPIAQKTWANTEATYLLAKYAFEEMGYRRLEWKCDDLNERSKASATKLGFTFEGVQDSHYIYKNRSRDTAWFRILDSDWESVKTHLETRLQY